MPYLKEPWFRNEPMRKFSQVLSVLMVAGLLLVTSTGCESQKENQYITANDIRNDLNPEYFTTLRSWEQRQNFDAITRNLNGRQMVDDWYRFWQAKPSRMTPYPNLY